MEQTEKGVCLVISKKGLAKDEELLKKFLEEQTVSVDVVVWEDVENKKTLERYDLVVIRTIWDYQQKYEKFMKFLNFLPRDTTVNDVDVMRWNSDKRYLLEMKGCMKSEVLLFNFCNSFNHIKYNSFSISQEHNFQVRSTTPFNHKENFNPHTQTHTQKTRIQHTSCSCSCCESW